MDIPTPACRNKLFLVLFFFLCVFAPQLGAQERQVEGGATGQSSETIPRQISTAPFIEWWRSDDSYRESVRETLSDPDFLGEFSMKRGYRLNPFLDELWAPSNEQIRRDIDETIHDRWCEETLVPLRRECYEKGIPIRFSLPSSERLEKGLPLGLILDETLFAQSVFACVSTDESASSSDAARRLGASAVFISGRVSLETNDGAIPWRDLPQFDNVILIPNGVRYDFSNESEECRNALFVSEKTLYLSTLSFDEKSVPLWEIGTQKYRTLFVFDFDNIRSRFVRVAIARFEKNGGCVKKIVPPRLEERQTFESPGR
ncbi:MAG: hypothetical protein Q4D38_05200 [Planctomycetia bacterium]|nr:hypothetical protein [Planctomycetia bacterium]